MTEQEQQMTETTTQAQGVKLDRLVKPLVWVEISRGLYCADIYSIDVLCRAKNGGVTLFGLGAAMQEFTSLEAAKAAAQADFAAKSVANFDTDAIAGLVGALREIRSGWTAAADPDTGELVEVAMSEDEMISIARAALARLGGGE
jgi:hypothetical protein